MNDVRDVGGMSIDTVYSGVVDGTRSGTDALGLCDVETTARKQGAQSEWGSPTFAIACERP